MPRVAVRSTSKDLGSFWAFPPILTLQYHFDPISGFKPYVGAGVQYIHYFDGGHSDLGGAKISLDDSWGFALQGGVDVEIGKGWYLNADIKKVWLDTDASWRVPPPRPMSPSTHSSCPSASATASTWPTSLAPGQNLLHSNSARTSTVRSLALRPGEIRASFFACTSRRSLNSLDASTAFQLGMG